MSTTPHTPPDSFTPSVLDGGLATLLERHGHDLSGSLWSAEVLRHSPEAIGAAHREFFGAGAQVATTATYQLTPDSLSRSGIDIGEFDSLTRSAVAVAAAARDAHGEGWVVGSIGPYGAALADGSEYTGDYGLGSDPEMVIDALRAHHRPRLQALLDLSIDALACETLPTVLEVQALVRELDALGSGLPVWFSVTPAPGGTHTRTGEPLARVSQEAARHPFTIAVGVNCCSPDDVSPALNALRPNDYGLAGIAYPNSGEDWDAAARAWRGTAAWRPGAVEEWRHLGATLVGGCCRVFPEQIRAMALSG